MLLPQSAALAAHERLAAVLDRRVVTRQDEDFEGLYAGMSAEAAAEVLHCAVAALSKVLRESPFKPCCGRIVSR